MGIIAQAAELNRRNALATKPVAELDPGDEPASGVMSAIADLPLSVLRGMAAVDERTRAVLGQAVGLPWDGEVTGEDLARAAMRSAGIGFPEQIEGRLDPADVIGFATEMAASPFNLLGLGTLTSTGRKAASATKALQRAEGLQAAGRSAAAAKAFARAAQRGITPTSERLGKTLAEQGTKGQRLLLGVGIPGRAPWFGVRGQPVLSGLTRAAQATRPFTEPIAGLFRGSGRIGDQAFDTQIDLSREVERFGRAVGAEEKSRIARFASSRDFTKDYDAFTQTIKAAVDREIAPLAAELAKAGPRKALQLRREIQRLSVLDGVGGDAADAMLVLGIEKHGVSTQIVDEIAKQRSKALLLENTLGQQIANAVQLGGISTDEMSRLQGRMTRLRNGLARRIESLQRTGRIADAVVDAAPADLRAEVDRIAFVTERTLRVERGSGVPTPRLGDVGLSYLYRFVSPEGRDWAGRRGVSDVFSRFARLNQTLRDFTKRRTAGLEGLTHFQINQMARNAGFDGDFMLTDPADILLRRLTGSGKARAAAHLAQGVVSNFAVPAGLLPDGVPIEDFIEKANISRVGQVLGLPKTAAGIRNILKGSQLEGMAIPKHIAEAYLRVNRVVEWPDQLKRFKKFADGLSGALRYGVTTPFPAFHSRNMVGNGFAMWLAGMRNPADWWRGVRMAGRIAGRESKFWRGVFGEATDAEVKLWRKVSEFGSAGSGLIAETAELGKRPVGDVLSRIPGSRTVQRYLGGMEDLGRILEDGSKAGLFLWGKLKRGMDDASAGDMVRKYLFDYQDLSGFEKGVARHLAFFYTYQRKAIPLMFEALFTNPATMRAYGNITGEKSGSIQEEMLPQYLRQRGQVFSGYDDEGRATFRAIDLPPTTLFQYGSQGQGAQRVGAQIAGALNPIYRAPIEFVTQRNLTTGKQYAGSQFSPMSALIPTTRLTREVAKVFDTESESTPADVGLNLLGIPPTKRFDPEQARRSRLIDQIDRALENTKRRGMSRSIQNYFLPKRLQGSADAERVRALLQARARAQKGP